MLAEYYTFVQLNSSNFAFGPDKINILLRIPYIYIYIYIYIKFHKHHQKFQLVTRPLHHFPFSPLCKTLLHDLWITSDYDKQVWSIQKDSIEKINDNFGS